ncbi:putative lipid II flippase FtsW [Candidatus Aerophobetes bacterium]|uniref:Probable peptidoglycan glycosyltransferase FtsW n=2 Tax=Aerophobetes bacterium TaxID=2030807 RepID=A0A662DA78_UNCAE|nr:MAG: putative lipid II flippase FtsW [Candidatus Aerophobetes bacterium]
MRKKPQVDCFLLIVVSLLCIIGVLAIFSAGAPFGYIDDNAPPYGWAMNQLKWLGLGVLFLFFASRLNYHFYKRFDRIVILFVILSLLLVFVPKLGRQIRGVHRWITFGSFQIQPSELAKLGIIIYLSCSLVRKKDRIISFIGGFLPYLIIISLIFLLVMIEPDLGSALIIAGVGFVLIYAGGAKISHMLYVAALGILPVYFSISKIGYRKNRIIAFLNPESDPLGIGFQPLHLKMSIGAGGLWGMGPGKGNEKLFYLPTPHTDSIFAVIGEEFGFIGTSLIVLLFLIFTWRGLKIAKRAPDELGKLLAIGLTCLISGQALINMGVATVILPTTGSALPFISYGGSSLLTSLVAIGILLNISKQSKLNKRNGTRG